MKPAFGNAATSAPNAASRRSPQRDGDRDRDHQQRAHGVDRDQPRVDQAVERQARAEPEQHARQREEQHVGVEARDRRLRQHLALRRQVAQQHQREEGHRDGEDGLHRRAVSQGVCLRLATAHGADL